MPKMTKKQEHDEAALKHGFKLQRIFPATAGILGPVQLYNALLHIENAAHRNAERLCNDPNYTTEMAERDDARILDRLDALLKFKAAGIPVFLNGDPRGYALKIESGYVREYKLDIHTDWGGYGILAPEFD
jgi:hypothetical protein